MSIKKNKKITLAIVGRPNVGKSTLFNRLIKKRVSIVSDTPGVTRDKLYSELEWNGKQIRLIDTGGLDTTTKDEILSEVKKQVLSVIDESDYVLFMVDGIAGSTSLDEKIASMLRKIKNKKKIFLAVNKIDTEKQLHNVYEFYSFGLGKPFPISALSGSSGMADILDIVSSGTNSVNNKDALKHEIKVAIVGKPNVGKSSLLNALLNENRSIVTSVAGTTRDSIDSSIEVNGKNYLLTDTAGLRKKARVSSAIERYATTRTIESIERSDVAVLVVEANSRITDQDKKIASVIKKRDKASIVVVNKWDLIEEKSSKIQNDIKDHIIKELQFINYSKVLFISALQKKNVTKLWDLISKVYGNYGSRISTSKLNKAVEDIVLYASPPTGKGGKSLRIYYVTQASAFPPEIVFFVNDSDLVKTQYEKFLEKQLREKFDFSGTPIKLVFRNKKKNT